VSESISVHVRTTFRASFGPATGSDRIESIDVLRGVALLGILLMNIIDFGLPAAAYLNPVVDNATSGANLWAYIVNWFAFEGSMRAIFSMLFGASVVLLTSRGEETDPSIAVADVYFRRTLLLIVFGLIDAYLLLWYGDILYSYGVCGLMLFVFRRASARTLLLLALIPFCVMQIKVWNGSSYYHAVAPVAAEARLLVEQGVELTEAQQQALDSYDSFSAMWAANPEAEAEEIAVRRSGYLDNVKQLAPNNAAWQSSLFYDFFFWDIMMMMFLGMALFKLQIFSASRSYGFYFGLLVIGYGVGFSANGYEIANTIDSNFDPIWMVPFLMPTYDLGRGGTALGHIALVMLICKAGLFTWVTHALAAVGRMALTNYLSHSLICMIVFTGVGFGLFGSLERYQLYYVVGAIWAFQLIASPLWLKYFRFGPVEWVWRSLTYGQAQRMRITAGAAEPA